MSRWRRPKPDQIGVRHLGADRHIALDSSSARRPQHAGITGMEPARHVGARDDLQHRGVVTHLPDPVRLPQVTVDVDGHHPATLRPPTRARLRDRTIGVGQPKSPANQKMEGGGGEKVGARQVRSDAARRWKHRRPLVRDSSATSSSSSGISRSGPPSAFMPSAIAAARSSPSVQVSARRTADGLGVATDRRVVALVHHGAVVEDVEHLVAGGVEADLGDEDLDLHRLHLVGEDRAEHLRVAVGEAAGIDVVARVLVSLEVGGSDPGDTELVELVVLADAGEGDAVVDLAHLAQRLRRVLGDDDDAVGVPDAPPAPDLGRCPCARSRHGPSSSVRGRRRTACSSRTHLRTRSLRNAWRDRRRRGAASPSASIVATTG